MSEDQNFGLFRPTTNVFQDTLGPRKSEMHALTPNGTWTLNTESTVYTLNTYRVSVRSKFQSVSLYD